MLSEKQQKSNNNIKLTLNNPSLPNGIDRYDVEWNNFIHLVKRNTRDRLINIILRMYKWTLPETLNERIIEYGFLERGWVTVFKDPLGIFALPCIPNNMYNIYGEPTQVQAMGYNGWNELVDIKYFTEYPQVTGFSNLITPTERYGVVARDNYANKKYIDYVEEFTEILTNNRLAIMVATETLKQPHITLIPKKALKKTAQQLIRGIHENKRQIIVVDEDIKQIAGQSMKDLIHDVDMSGNIEAPKKLMEVYNANFNIFLELLGINTNPSPDKSEVVLTPEINSNNSLIDLEQDVRFLNRKKLCEDAKKVLGIDISVEKNIDETNKLINEMRYNAGGVEDGDESGHNEKDTE